VGYGVLCAVLFKGGLLAAFYVPGVVSGVWNDFWSVVLVWWNFVCCEGPVECVCGCMSDM